MKQAPIVPADVDFDDPLAPSAPRFGDVYHARSGAFEQARHVFLSGNGLPARWQERPHFTVLETGFGLGNNFLATWAAWRADPRRSQRLCFISVEQHPLRREDLRRAHEETPGRPKSPHTPAGGGAGLRHAPGGTHAQSPEPALAAELVEAWPPLTPDFHRLSFDEGRVELLLVLGDAGKRLRDVVANVDAFYLDGFAPARNPRMWEEGVFTALARLSAPGATAATWSSARVVRDGLAHAGFAWRRADGRGGKRDITLADFSPRGPIHRPVARRATAPVRRVAIIGGGLAGASCARSLAEAGIACVVVDRRHDPAAEGSGNSAGLFHGIVHRDDGLHARAHRVAAMMAGRDYARAIASGVPGDATGLLRLEPAAADDGLLQAAIATCGLPPEYVQAWSTDRVRDAGGPACPAWFYPNGGWISPAGLVRAWLRASGADWRGDADVVRLQRDSNEGVASWRVLDAEGRLLAEADAVVLANAAQIPRLAAAALDRLDGVRVAPLPELALSRGQVTELDPAIPDLRRPRWPLAGAGYAIPLGGGALLCGATNALGDPDLEPRVHDDLDNLRKLVELTGGPRLSTAALDAPAPADWSQRGWLRHRVGQRAATADRLPWIGAVPATWTGEPARTPNQPRHWPRVPGLFIAGGFGSRGLTWAPLAGRLITAWITQSPFPVDATLVDAFDPARIPARVARRPDA